MDIISLIGGFLVLGFAVTVAAIILGVGLNMGGWKCAKVLHCCSEVPGRSSASRGLYSIVDGMALKHGDPKNWKVATDKEKLDHHMVYDVYSGDARGGAEAFIELCHMVGIEIVIRPVNKDLLDTDKNPEETRKRLRVLRKKYYREIGRRR